MRLRGRVKKKKGREWNKGKQVSRCKTGPLVCLHSRRSAGEGGSKNDGRERRSSRRVKTGGNEATEFLHPIYCSNSRFGLKKKRQQQK